MMTQNLAWSEILFFIIITIAGLVAWQFIKSRNGMLRKIMIAYFCTEIFVYGASAVYFWMYANHYTKMNIDVFRVIVITPKTIMMLWLYLWLRKKK